MMMNRKDFKKLLVEWNQNFVSEVASLSTVGVDFEGLTGDQESFVKEVLFDANLYALGDFDISTSEGLMTLSHFIMTSMKSSKHKIKLKKPLLKGMILDKACIKSELIPVLNLALDELDKSGFSYRNYEGETISVESQKSGVEKIKESFQQYAEMDAGLILYFARMSGSIEAQADGTINKIASVQDESVWKNSLFWELKHDLFHAFEDLLEYTESYIFMRDFRFTPAIGEVIRNFKTKYGSGGSSKDGEIKFSSSAGDYDNFASLIPHIRSLGNNQTSKEIFIEECNSVSKEHLGRDLSDSEKEDFRKFFDAAHSSYDEIGKLLKDKVLIQKAHG